MSTAQPCPARQEPRRDDVAYAPNLSTGKPIVLGSYHQYSFGPHPGASFRSKRMAEADGQVPQAEDLTVHLEVRA